MNFLQTAVGAALFAGVTLTAAAADEPPSPLKLLDRVTGDKAANFNDFLLDDGAFEVSAAGLAGVDASALTTVENTRDVSVYLKAFNSDGKGGGFAVTPARAKSPFPRFSMSQYVDDGPGGIWVRSVAALTFSYAEGTADTDGKSYRRRAASASSSFYLRPASDDPIWVGLTEGSKCMAELLGDFEKGKFNLPVTPTLGAPDPQAEAARQQAESKKLIDERMDRCIKPRLDRVAKRWFRPLVSLVLGTGDVAQDQTGGASASLGTIAAASIRFGGGVGTAQAAGDGNDFDYGWALSMSARRGRNEPVLSSLGSAALAKRDTSLVAARLAFGTETARLLAEASNAKSRQADTGDRTFKRAVGLEWHLGKTAWIHFRYGDRFVDADGKVDRASLLSLSLGPQALDVTSWFR